MSEDLLLQLKTAASVAGSLENIDDLLRVVVREADCAVQGMKGSALLFENAWKHIVLEVARGRTTENQAARPLLLGAFDKRLSLLKGTYALTACLHKLGREAASGPDVLLPEIAGMERLKVGVFDLWQTPDDLEDLAARDYPLTTADLDRIGPHLQPPASYYAEESKPF